MEALFLAIGTAGAVFLTAMVRGYVLSALWGWFVVPTFGAPALSVAIACGLSLLISMLTHQKTPQDTRPAREQVFEAVIGGVVASLLTLGMGRIILAFV